MTGCAQTEPVVDVLGLRTAYALPEASGQGPALVSAPGSAKRQGDKAFRRRTREVSAGASTMTRVTPCISRPVVIVGRHSSGKSTLARAVAAAANARVFELGTGVRKAARDRGLRNLVGVAHDLLAENPIYLAVAAIHRAGGQSNRCIFVGARTAVEFDYLLANLQNPLTVGLKATTKYRRRQWNHRHLKFSDTWDEREWRETHWETDKLIQHCELIIDASDDLEIKSSQICEVLLNSTQLT